MQVVSELDWKIYLKQLRTDKDNSNRTKLYLGWHKEIGHKLWAITKLSNQELNLTYMIMGTDWSNHEYVLGIVCNQQYIIRVCDANLMNIFDFQSLENFL